MERLGDELLAGAAFALEEDGGAAGGDLGDEVEEAEHGLGLADDVFEVVALLEGALELDDFFFGAVAADGGADIGEELFVVPGLLDEVVGAGADGFDDIETVPKAVIMMTGRVGWASRMRGRSSRPLSPGRARSSSRRS